MKTPILSIGILVSDSYEKVEKCIRSLDGIRRALPCQLILTDTRPFCENASDTEEYNDLTAFLQKEADVYHRFTWCDDFAAARNANLENAIGKWYMYLDDDEYITDGVEDFVAFFKDDENDAFDSGQYIQRNHHDCSGNHYSDYSVQRIKKLTPDTRFESKIHEYMVPYPKKVVVFNLVAEHYGYVYDNEEEKEAHKMRNRTLLLDMLDEDSANLRCRQQLLLEMADDADWHTFTDLALENLAYIDGHDQPHEIPMVWDLYGGAVYGLVRLMQLPRKEDLEAWHFQDDTLEQNVMPSDVYEQLDAVVARGLKDARCGNLCKAALHRALAIGKFHAGDLDAAKVARATYAQYLKRALSDSDALMREETAPFIALAKSDPFPIWSKPVLSIGMLVSDGKGTARACIRALRFLRSRIPCELIITDTRPNADAKSDLTAFLRQEADAYHTFTWCDDFAKARNTNLEKASGEWYMYLDDDELMTDVTSLIGFFESGAYHDSDCAEIIVRSFDDYGRGRYEDAYLPRLRKRVANLHFEDRIHEHLMPPCEKSMPIRVIADHFGYVFENEEARKAHEKRNRDLLDAMLSENPKNLRVREQLLLEYCAADDLEGLLALAKESLQVAKNSSGRFEDPLIWAFYGAGAFALSNLEEYDALFKWCVDGLTDQRLGNMCRGYLSAYASEYSFAQKAYTKALQYMKTYFAAFDEEDPDGSYYHMELGVPFINVAFSKEWTARLAGMANETESLLKMKAQLEDNIAKLKVAGQTAMAETMERQLQELFPTK